MMEEWLRSVRKKQSNFRKRRKSGCSSNDMAAMLCFILGVYGERFFLYLYSRLGAISPKVFCLICLMGTYFIITKFIHK